MSDSAGRRKHGVWLLVPALVVAAAGAWLFLDPGFRSKEAAPDLASAMPADEFDRRVRDYILDNPEIIMESVRRLEARQRTAEEGEATAVLKARSNEIFRDPDSPVGGNPQGDATLVEFFDYNCPYCRQVAPVMQKAEAADPQLRVVYKEFPILGTNSMFAAKAALAVRRQGKYLAFHNALMEGRGAVDQNRVLETAARIGVDAERMKVDMADPAIESAINKNLELAQALRISGTPSFVVGDKILRGATDLKALQALIREARDRAPAR